MNSLSQIKETVLYGADLPAMERFYGTALGLEFYGGEPGRYLFFRCGEGMVLVFHPHEAGQPERGIPRHGALPGHLGPNGELAWAGHMAFSIAPEDAPGWRTRLAAHEIEIESELDWPQGGHSIYFRDPAGNSIELMWGLWS